MDVEDATAPFPLRSSKSDDAKRNNVLKEGDTHASASATKSPAYIIHTV